MYTCRSPVRIQRPASTWPWRQATAAGNRQSQPQIADTRLTLSLFSFSDVTRMSSTLSYESRKYQKNAKALSRQALIKKYMPFAIIGGVIFVVLFFRWLFY